MKMHNSAYGGYFQPSLASVAHPAVNPISRFGSYTTSNQQGQTYSRSVVPNQDSMGMMNQYQQFQQSDPMLGVSWGGNNLGRSSFSEFVSGQQGFEEYPYGLNSNDMDIKPFGLQQSSAPSQPYMGQSGYHVGYPNYSAASMTLPSQPLGNFNMSTTTTNDTANATWMPETPRAANTQLAQNSLAYYPTHDGLPTNLVSTPRHQPQQQQGKLWNASNSTDMKWASQASSPSTISPKQMHIASISPHGSFSYSASNPGTTPSHTDSSSETEEDSDYAASEKMVVEKVGKQRERPIRPARQKLPDSASSSNRRNVPILPSNGYSSNVKSIKAASPKPKPIRPSRTKPNASGSSKLSTSQKSKYVESNSQTPTPKRIQPNGPTPAPSWKRLPQTVMQAQVTPQQNAKDQFLVESKLAGMSYKEIRRKGGFTEAESTLRGRFRTLTKHKADRVRKPEWSDNDVCLFSPVLE